MLVVIFGAGASYDSVAPRFAEAEHAEVWRPPLARQLFEARPGTFGPAMQKFPVARALFMRLDAAIARGILVEDEIQRIVDEIGDDELGIRQLTGLRFYLQQIIWDAGTQWSRAAFGQTNYVILSDAIERWRRRHNEEVTYLTFNYDLMLEDALEPFFAITGFESYVAGPTRLIKAHGSVDWGHAVVQRALNGAGDHRRDLIYNAPSWWREASGWYRFVGSNISTPGPRREAAHELLYPALALPTTGKLGFECPSDHLAALEDNIKRMTTLLVIGWRAQERHALALLAEARQAITGLVVSGTAESAASIAAVLGETMPRLEAQTAGGFTDLVKQPDAVTAFLNEALR